MAYALSVIAEKLGRSVEQIISLRDNGKPAPAMSVIRRRRTA
jgi:hypothetical protein